MKIVWKCIVGCSLLLITICNGQPPPHAHRALSNSSDLALDNAITITLEKQQGIALDSALFQEIYAKLAMAQSSIPAIRSIYAFPDYSPYEMLFGGNFSWTQAWLNQTVMTGFRPEDSLDILYGLESVYDESFGFLLNFRKPLRIDRLGEAYMKNIPGCFASANNIYGDGDRILAFKKNGVWDFVFMDGWGDCSAGCIHRNYWYVSVDALNAHLEDSLMDQEKYPLLRHWNIPTDYPSSAFSCGSDVLSALSSPRWWVRRHALVVVGDFFQHSTPWSGEDHNNSAFTSMREFLRDHQAQMNVYINPMLQDTDDDVRAAAERTLGQINSWRNIADEYFPLAVGNSWTLTRGSISATERITDKSLDSSNNAWFRFDTLRYMPEVSVRTTADNKVLIRKDSAEQVWLDFAADSGKPWTVYSPISKTEKWSVSLESTTDSVSTPEGFFTQVYRFHFKYDGADNDWTEWFAPYVGLIKRVLDGFGTVDYNLTGYTILPTAGTGEPGVALPAQVELFPIYPNPAVSQFIVSYNIKLPQSFVRISLRDLLGRELKVLLEGRQGGGKYRLPAQADGLAPGMYRVVLQTGTRMSSFPVMVVR